jgi:predicted TPR repeat methyltransferase
MNRKDRRRQDSQRAGAAAPRRAAPPPGASLSATLLALANQPTDLRPDFERLERELAQSRGRSGAVPDMFNELRRRNALDGDVDSRRRAHAADPHSPFLAFQLADALRARGDHAEAIELYRRCLAVPETAEASRFCLAALGAEPMPEAMPGGVVAALFDQYAKVFDSALLHGLKYQGPAVIAGAVAAILGPGACDLDVLDLGCGTGLCGAVLRPLARRLDGVDISAAMIEQAAAKRLYDGLTRDDLCAALPGRRARYDLAVAGDVMMYLGDLAPALAAVCAALRPRGHFVFTTERAAAGRYELHAAARYRHADAYVAEAGAAAGFELLRREECVVRFEQGQPVASSLFAFRRA